MSATRWEAVCQDDSKTGWEVPSGRRRIGSGWVVAQEPWLGRRGHRVDSCSGPSYDEVCAGKLGDRSPVHAVRPALRDGPSRQRGRGKSELRRAVCSLTARAGGGCPIRRAVRLRYGKCHRKHTASFLLRDGVRVKRCGPLGRPPSRAAGRGKSAPLRWRHRRQGKPHTEQDQIGEEGRPAPHVPPPAGLTTLG